MKKFFGLIITLLLLFSLSSCGKASKSYDKLSKIKNEIGKSYITFGEEGIVIDGDYKKITYDDIFDCDINLIDVKKIGDYAYLVGYKSNYYYLSKYNLNDDTYETNKFEVEKGKSDECLVESGLYIINYGENHVDTAYYIDLEFNVYSQILTEIPNCYTDMIHNDSNAIFAVYDATGDDVYLDYGYYFDNGFVKIEFPQTIHYDKMVSLDSYLFDNCYVEGRNHTAKYIYDFKTNNLSFNDKVIDDKIKEYYIKNDVDIPKFNDVKRDYKFFNQLIDSYCYRAELSALNYIYKFDDKYYYGVRTGYNYTDLSTFFGAYTYEVLEPIYIYYYDEINDKALYVGYSKGNLKLLYVR